MSGERLAAWRAEFYAPVASFRDPLFPGLSHGLPLPPPSTVRGLLAAATGRPAEDVPFGMSAWAEGSGVDTETYHPVAAGGANPAVSGRVRAVKGGMTIRDRPFLVGLHLTVWLPGPEGGRIADALRRPRWALRLGRSQDVVHLRGMKRVELEPAEEGRVGHTLAPASGHDIGSAQEHRMAASVSADRLTTRWADYLWCDIPAGVARLRGAYREVGGPRDREDAIAGAAGSSEGEQAVWLLTP
ncbi:CRISPR-associated protein Cas5 [Streptomyces johnsoniae]|uniref:CRISPR-associated protein Cas5 n=1 Tax=Streptomyces johnsoniae TaxID=3075532 RepID=A0ABU2SDU6_9ACTN|nr:CRISPR-associated protein Cas5 [Streptomyces sp. DSM 41886]MDT0446836.1 CRISPR-associated protein Cas5 [Streptomyces sp. DSM 41886]